MVRRSRLVERKESETAASGRKSLEGRRGWMVPSTRAWRRARAEGLGAEELGGRGAWWWEDWSVSVVVVMGWDGGGGNAP